MRYVICHVILYVIGYVMMYVMGHVIRYVIWYVVGYVIGYAIDTCEVFNNACNKFVLLKEPRNEFWGLKHAISIGSKIFIFEKVVRASRFWTPQYVLVFELYD